MPPAGVRVEPDVYCRYAGPRREWSVVSRSRVESESSRSTSITAGPCRPSWLLAYLLTSVTTDEVVSNATGALSCSADATLRSRTPNWRTHRRTATQQHC